MPRDHYRKPAIQPVLPFPGTEEPASFFSIPDDYYQDDRLTLDLLTSWYQPRMRNLSPQESGALIAFMQINKDKPVSTPASVRAISEHRFLNPNSTAKAMRRLEKVNLLREANAADLEKAGMKPDGRQSFYIIKAQGFEQWYRARNFADRMGGDPQALKELMTLRERSYFDPV